MQIVEEKRKDEACVKNCAFPLLLLVSLFGMVCGQIGAKKRRIAASISCAVMVFAMLPAMPLAAFAETSTPLTFTAEENSSSVTLDYVSGSDVMCRLGDGSWTAYSKGTAIPLNNGESVSFKGTDVVTGFYNYFSMTGRLAASGDVTSLTNGEGGDVALSDSCYYRMFRECAGLTSAPNLPSTTLAESCYAEMFWGCTNLGAAPALPATTLTENCYDSMFMFCPNLSKAPVLASTTMQNGCYSSMFQGCTSLTEAPVLPATTLEANCYSCMFQDCSSLVSAPALPAKTLKTSCYFSMFEGCTSLTEAPILPATTLDKSCYYGMFEGCTSLTEAPALPATTLADFCYREMLRGCTGLTTAPALPATTLAGACYYGMFAECAGLATPPELPATTLTPFCYSAMFYDCTDLKISDTKTGPYNKAWRIPTTGTAATADDWNSTMFAGTGGPFTADPTLNTTYYLYDMMPPAISGLEDGKTYCVTASFTVSDEGLDTVTANGVSLSATEGTYVLTSVDTNVVVATDKAGNSTTVTVTLNADHTWDNGVVTKEPTLTENGVKTYTCTVCGETKTEEIPMLTSPNTDGANGNDQQSAETGTKTPETGDTDNMILLSALLLVSCGALTTFSIILRRKRARNK